MSGEAWGVPHVKGGKLAVGSAEESLAGTKGDSF